ncbi:zinc carboxypeptidase-like [Diorhabda sublineata]|uniref:zinc carboxypeptidase-like n=1 Tax=Diorhabda sublineata TaxID=1163346 RepID=UPI0024E0D31F|nr:zinc carboxypeptidase-like [Diorhabda sublineata]
MNCSLILLLGLFSHLAIGIVTYDDHALYRIVPKNSESVDILRLLQKSESEKYDFWTFPRAAGMPVDILVSPQQKSFIEKLVNENKMDYEILIENIQENIDEEARFNKNNLNDVADISWEIYNDLDTINNWLQKLAQQYPDIVTLLEGGKSYENRTILGVKVSYGSQNKNRGVWIDSNIHAREWISSATNTFLLNAILTSDDPVVRQIAKSHDWYIFPVINPDGFVYSYTTDRLWRKNRSLPYGVDLNRNWDYKWNGDACTDISKQSDVYCGTAAFSEIETSSLANFISTIAEDLVLLLTFHSYSQFMIIPYGDSERHVDNYNVTYAAAVKAAESLAQRYGTQYSIGTAPELLYQAFGISMDWAKAQFQIPYVYTYELRDKGKYGFLLPTDQIIPTGLETLDSIITLLQEADKQLSSNY